MPHASLTPGALVMIVPGVLQPGPLRGYPIAQRLHQITSSVLQLEERPLYPALQRILVKGWTKTARGSSASSMKRWRIGQ